MNLNQWYNSLCNRKMIREEWRSCDVVSPSLFLILCVLYNLQREKRETESLTETGGKRATTGSGGGGVVLQGERGESNQDLQ